MSENPKNVLLWAVGSAFVLAAMAAGIAHGATKGDQIPKGRTGQACVPGEDGGTFMAQRVIIFADAGSAVQPGRNAMLVKNPAGSGGTVCCGYSQDVRCGGGSAPRGFPLEVNSSIAIDITCPGGAVGASNGACPTLYCINATGLGPETDDGGISCLRWMEVE